MSEQALLIGGNGFVGKHMNRILKNEFTVTSTGREFDIRDKELICDLVESVRPSVVINFAFVTTVLETFADPYYTYQTGLIGMLNLLQALKSINFNGKILNISSSEVYGFPDQSDFPIGELAPLKPMSPYSVAKISAESLCYQWCKSEGMHIVTARPFTHIGPGQSDRFALSSFAKQLAEMELGLKEHVMNVGNLCNTRDITDVRDVVKAYYLLLKYGQKGEIYNVCSGSEVEISVLLDHLIEISGIEVAVNTDKSLVRSLDKNRIIGSYNKLKNATGWSPEISLEITLSDMIKFWKEQLN
jgi:GDP-4-dehydro-6-deoxy-D-mannose reductase